MTPIVMDKITEIDLNTLRSDLLLYKDMLKETSLEIMSGDFSSFPIFVAHQFEASIGQVILDRKELGTTWTVHASTFEEFVEIGIITKDKTEFFKKTYKDPNEFICIFIITEKGGKFVFIPYNFEASTNPN
jgi:hypothetical protein